MENIKCLKPPTSIMAIFNSYVKLPEGIYHDFSAEIRRHMTCFSVRCPLQLRRRRGATFLRRWRHGACGAYGARHRGPGFANSFCLVLRWFEKNSNEHTSQKTDVEQPHSPGFVVYSIIASPQKG